MANAVIVAAVRTPVGRYGGALKDVRPDDLAALVIRELVERTHVDPGIVDDVIFGNTNQAGEDNRNVARMALLIAGLPETIPGQTVNRLCASGLQAVNTAAINVQAGAGDVYIAGGVESMTRAPFVMAKPATGFPRGKIEMEDSTIGWRFVNPRLAERYERSRREMRLPATFELIYGHAWKAPARPAAVADGVAVIQFHPRRRAM